MDRGEYDSLLSTWHQKGGRLIWLREIIISGFGGQGVMSMGQLLTYAGMLDGKNVSWYLPTALRCVVGPPIAV